MIQSGVVLNHVNVGCNQSQLHLTFGTKYRLLLSVYGRSREASLSEITPCQEFGDMIANGQKSHILEYSKTMSICSMALKHTRGNVYYSKKLKFFRIIVESGYEITIEKTNAKVIAAANHNKIKHHNGRFRSPSNYL